MKTRSLIKALAAVVTLIGLTVSSNLALAGPPFVTEDKVGGGNSYYLNFRPGSYFNVKIIGKVEDDCWPNARASLIAVELELKRSGYKIGNRGTKMYLIRNGFEPVPGLCVMSYQLDIDAYLQASFYAGSHVARTNFRSTLWSEGGLVSTPKSNVPSYMKEQYVELVQSFISYIDFEKERTLESIRRAAKGDEKIYWDKYELD